MVTNDRRFPQFGEPPSCKCGAEFAFWRGVSDTSRQFGRARPLTRCRRLWYHSSCSRGRNPLNPREAQWIAGGCSV